ncbi:MAG: hypothetical protein LBO72_04305 [Helicobacteraceae bacterium]|nr:hypothetical protein [Helicobacteraceae bacterium]
METIYLEGVQIPLWRYEENGVTIWKFDSSAEACPAPMTTAIAALRLIDAPNKRLIMINHSRPNALLVRVKDRYAIAVREIENGLFEIAFERL